MTSKFQILAPHYPQLFKICETSEKLFEIDHNSTISKLRLFTEKVIELIYRLEQMEYPDTSSMVDRINELFAKNYLPKGVKSLFHKIRKDGNRAVHKGDLTPKHAFLILNACYRVSIWFIETYENIFVEDTQYSLPKSKNVEPFEILEAEIIKSPIVSENFEQKVGRLNKMPAVIENRKQRSKKSAKRLKLNSLNTILIGGALGMIPSTAAMFALGISPFGLATGAISGLGYLAYLYHKEKKKN